MNDLTKLPSVSGERLYQEGLLLDGGGSKSISNPKKKLVWVLWVNKKDQLRLKKF